MSDPLDAALVDLTRPLESDYAAAWPRGSGSPLPAPVPQAAHGASAGDDEGELPERFDGME